MADEDQPIEALDGTMWLYFPDRDEWTGWQPGEDGVWIVSDDQMRASYPEVLRQAGPDW